MDWNRHVLRDLVYERVRQYVDLISVVELEREIADSVERALASDDSEGIEADALSRELLDDAWRRLEAEWNVLRNAECALCSELGDRSRAIT